MKIYDKKLRITILIKCLISRNFGLCHKTALTQSFLAQFTSILLHMKTDKLFLVLEEESWNGVLNSCENV